MDCCSCDNINKCEVFNTVFAVSDNFTINDCKNYRNSAIAYKKIAENDALMCLIYDYFLRRIDGKFRDSEVREVIERELLKL